tara:strand:+ start:22 stop:213 length:192 start_codon:yes stop_codon:yes gene_type:complete
MDAIYEFLTMGGYAAFVWPAFGITVGVMAGLLVASLRGLRQERQTLELMENARPRRRDRDAGF